MINRRAPIVIALFLLIFVQQLVMLVESIYMLNLLHTSMDARAFAVLFLYAGLFLLFFKTAKVGRARVVGVLFVLFSLPGPWITTEWRIMTAGIAVAFFLLLLGLDAAWAAGDWFVGSVLATLLSVLLRLFGASQDIVLVGNGRILGLLLALVGIFLFFKRTPESPSTDLQEAPGSAGRRIVLSLGFFSCLFFLYAFLAAPDVLSRWTAVDYRLIHLVLALSIAAVVRLFLWRKKALPINRILYVAWNLLFVAALTFVLLHNRIHFPETAAASPVVVVAGIDIPNLLGTILMLMLSPVIFVNMALFREGMKTDRPFQLALPFFLGGLLLSLFIFMLIFTNVWGYVGAASRVFRNRFHLPFLLAGLGLMPAILFVKSRARIQIDSTATIIATVLGAAIVVVALASQSAPKAVSPKTTLTVMTYNIQQGVDYRGAKNYAKQLQVIRRVDPDILCLQESDVARISGGNSDVVRFFAQKLNYFSYYGPKTVTGTFGAAILSRFPLFNCRSIFTYSNVDEIGTAFADIAVGGDTLTVACNHPAGGKAARQAHIDMLRRQVQGRNHLLVMGDFNFRPASSWYQQITGLLSDAWSAAWPDGVGDMGALGIRRGDSDARDGKCRWLDDTHLAAPDRIDHIFVGREFQVLQAAYLPVPESQSDHPAHWAVLRFRGSNGEGGGLMSISGEVISND